MEWEKVLWAVLIGLMILVLLPRAKQMLTQSRAAGPGDWAGALLPMALVVGFVILLLMLVRG